MGKGKDRKVDFWTQNEYQKFIEQVANKPASFYAFEDYLKLIVRDLLY